MTEDETAEAEPETTEEPAKSETAETPKRKRFPLPLSLPVAVVLAVVLLAAIAGAVTFGLLYKDKADVDSASTEALNVARSYAVTVTSYDYQNLDKNFADVIDGATGEFKDQYSGASATLRQLIQQAKATARGTVIDAGVKSASADRADVTLFVDQSVTNAATPQPRVDRNRVVMTLEKHDNRWLVSNLQLI
jgi:Mce-associated membrane protein